MIENGGSTERQKSLMRQKLRRRRRKVEMKKVEIMWCNKIKKRSDK